MIDEEKTPVRVIFKIIQSELIAFILDDKGHIVDANPGHIVCYAHIGQHSEASYDYYRKGRHATPQEYADLKAELEAIGYEITVGKRIQH